MNRYKREQRVHEIRARLIAVALAVLLGVAFIKSLAYALDSSVHTTKQGRA